MAAPRQRPDDDPGYTEDPDLFENDLTLGRAPIYQEESGAQRGTASRETLHPCESCGVSVIVGELDNGRLIAVEPQTATYVMRWLNKAPRPQLRASRGYPAHVCRR